MRLSFRFVLLAAAIALLAPVAARAADFALDDATRDQLCKEAREAYDRSQAYLDKVNYAPALDAMIVAAEKQPDLPDLGFLVGAFASNEARKCRGEEAIAFLHKAETAYEKVLDIPSLRRTERLNAESALAKVKASIASEADRDARMQKTSQALIKSRTDLIEQLRTARAAEVAAQNALNAPSPNQGAPGTGRLGAGGGGRSGVNMGGSNMGGGRGMSGGGMSGGGMGVGGSVRRGG